MDKFSPKNETEPFLKDILFCTKTAEMGLPTTATSSPNYFLSFWFVRFCGSFHFYHRI
jgi:hypothetical protein